MNRQLFVCNSVYQILVALWIKYKYHMGDQSDIIVSNHMNGAEKLVKSIRETNIFNDVYYVESEDFAKFRVKMSRNQRIDLSLRPNHSLKRFVDLKSNYTHLYIANVDFFSQLLFDALAHRFSELKLNIFEDGLFTYSRLYEKDYKSTFIPQENGLKKFVHTRIYRKKTIFGNVSSLLVFNPENMMWTPEFNVKQLEKIDSENEEFKDICNQAFEFDKSADVYDRRFIFLEESFFAEGANIDDVEILNKLAERIGRENIMVKIHPRNPKNRFAELGYKTNVDTNIPWELILMNVDLSDKVLITISSSSILNPILIFGKKVRAYSLYECVDHEHCQSRLLSGEMWEIAYKLFTKYSNMISICNSVDEIV